MSADPTWKSSALQCRFSSSQATSAGVPRSRKDSTRCSAARLPAHLFSRQRWSLSEPDGRQGTSPRWWRRGPLCVRRLRVSGSSAGSLSLARWRGRAACCLLSFSQLPPSSRRELGPAFCPGLCCAHGTHGTLPHSVLCFKAE